MGLKTNIALGLMAVGGLALGGGSAAYLYIQNKQAHAVSDDLAAFDLSSIAGYTPAEGDESIILKHVLSGGNTSLAWDAEKNTEGGKHDAFSGTWKNLTGAVVWDDEAQTLKALEVVIQTNSVIGQTGTHKPAPPTLTDTLIGETPGLPAWFDLESHPTASFSATEFVTREQADTEGITTFDNAPDGWTHLIRGTFSLNGSEIKLDIPAKADFIGEDLVLTLGFQLNRSDFDIDGTIIGGWVVDDTIHFTATVESAPKGDIIVETLRNHSVAISQNEAMIASMDAMKNQVQELTTQVTALREALASGATGGPAASYDITDLPERFTDTIVYPVAKPQTFPKLVADALGGIPIIYPDRSPMPFDMVLVPGDEAAGVAPFYMAEYELTWKLFYDWAYANDIYVQEQADLELLDLRPSPLYQDCDQLKIGLGDRPALSMSRLTAEAFCKWLSQETGRRYRLPTDTEWLHALTLGGGIPSDRSALLNQATLLDNAESQAAEAPDPLDPFADVGAEEKPPLVFSTPVGSREPNALGIYDMIGNASEWVADTGAERYVRGGHFRLAIDDLSADWRSVEDQKVWNETYPQKPNSEFWYRDHYYQGIRLVCEPVNLPE